MARPIDSKQIEEASVAEANKVNITRAGIYSFLSRAFKLEIDEQFLKSIAAIQPAIALLGEAQETEELEQGSKLLGEFTRRIDELKGEERKMRIMDLAAEYAGIFLGFGPKPVHLVESVYLGKDHLLYQQPYHEIVAAYKSLRFEKDKKFPEPEDHVSVEFDFMASLCRWTSQTLQDGDIKKAIAYLNLQGEFLRDHIIRWVPDLCGKLKDAATSDFYRAIGHLTNGFITLDNEMPDHLTEMLNSTVSKKK